MGYPFGGSSALAMDGRDGFHRQHLGPCEGEVSWLWKMRFPRNIVCQSTWLVSSDLLEANSHATLELLVRFYKLDRLMQMLIPF